MPATRPDDMSAKPATHKPRRAAFGGPSLSRLILKLAGWHISPFPSIDKAVVIGGPHTSNWDALMALLSGMALELDTTILIKKNAFKWPFGALLRYMGGMPIDRAHTAGVVEQAVELFNQRDRMILIITPEGTRTSAPRWKTGFYHIARLAKVPIVMAATDYAQKTLTFPLIFKPGPDMAADMQRMFECFGNVTPKHPENLSAPIKAVWDRKHKREP